MYVAWFLNHSNTPNARHQDSDNMYYALKDISTGEEITIDYCSIERPDWTARYVKK